MRRIFTLLTSLILVVSLFGQTKTITGTIKGGDTDETLPGVSIVIKGTTKGVISNFEGKYSIEASKGDVLEFSYVGYLPETVQVAEKSQVDLVMIPDIKDLEEVVITAIGIKAEKKSLGYAVQEVKGDDITKTTQANIVNSLSSKVAGVEVTSSSGTPGASSNIVIRGRTSLLRSNSPLFVIDGIPMDNDYSGSYYVDHSNRAIDLNSDDIESVTVLKGASATALYGIRAANGAIVITTKSGKSGKKKHTNITFKQTLGFDMVNKLPEKQYQYAQGSGGEYSSSANTSWGPNIDTLRYDGADDYILNPNGHIVGMSDPAATDQKVVPFDNIDDFFQNGIKSNTYVSMSGGNEMGNYYMSAGHLTQKGIVPLSEFARTTFKLTGELNLTDKLSISGTASYSNSGGTRMQKGSNLSAVMVGLMRVTPTFDITNGTDDPVNNESAYMLPDGTQRNYYPNYDNPYWSINKNKAFDNVNRLIGNTQMNYEVFPWLNAMYRVGLDYYNERRKNYLDNNSSDTDNGYLNISTFESRIINSDFVVTAEKKVTDDVKLSLVGGHNFYKKSRYSLSERGDKFILPNYYDISNTETTSGDDRKTDYGIVGVYYDFKIAYKNFLFLNTTGRNDWSSTLPEDANSFFYPSVNLGFIFSDAFNLEDKISFFNYGKIRASWAQVGYDADPYSLENYFVGIDGGIQGQVVFPTSRTIGNKKIEPEKTTSSEVGLDFRFFKNRLGFDIAYYNSKSVGQILPISIAYSTGYSSLIFNSGTVSNKGIEAQLHVTPVEVNDFTWNVMFNFTKNNNIVEELPEGFPLIEFETTGLSSTRSVGIEGEPFGVIYGGRFLRNDAGAILVGDDGYPLIDPVAGVVGDPNPDFNLGIRNSLTYKGLSLTAYIDIKQGGVIFNGTRAVMTSLGTHAYTLNRDEDFVFDGVNVNTGEPNDVAVKRDRDFYSRQAGLAGLSEAYLEDASYVRLREVALNYSMPSKWFDNAPFKSFTVGVSGRNLLLFTNYSGIDPETNLSGVANSLGRDYFNMPNTKGVEFTLQVTF